MSKKNTDDTSLISEEKYTEKPGYLFNISDIISVLFFIHSKK